MQVSEGQEEKYGNVIIQTYQPEHPIIKMCKDYKIDEFYESEINLRKKNNQPPFSNFISIISSSKRKQDSFKELENIKKNLNKNLIKSLYMACSSSNRKKK